MENRKCNKCKVFKPLSEFSKRKSSKDGLHQSCKECNNERVRKYSRTKEGVITRIYAHQKQSSKARGHKLPSYTKEELKKWCFNQKLWEKLFKDWIKSGYKKDLAPSVDRKDDYKSYTINNIQLMTFKDNREKGHKDVKKGRNNKQSKAVFQLTKEGVFIKEYYSASQAKRETGINHGHICSCCRSKRKSAGGFKWRFKS